MTNSTLNINRSFKHEASGKIFYLHHIANLDAAESKRGAWPVIAVYEDAYGQVWACEYARFRTNLRQLNTGGRDRAINKPGSPKRYFKHEESGKIFVLHHVANIDAAPEKRATWPIIAVYEDAQGQVWACEYQRFRSNLYQINPATGARLE